MPGIKNHWRRLRQSSLIKHTALLFSGNLVALIIPFLAAPFILRLYSPEDVAAFEIFVRILEVLVVLATLRYELAIVLPKSNRRAQSVVQLCLALIFITAVIVFLGGTLWQWLQGSDPGYPPGFLMAAGVIIVATFSVINQWLIRNKNFQTIAGSRFYAAAANNGTKYLAGLLGPQPLGLIIGHFMGFLIPLGIMVFRHRLIYLLKFTARFTSIARQTATSYRDFPRANLPHTLSDEAQKALLFLLIAYLYDNILLGLFAVTFRYVRVPVQVFGHSLGQVLVQRFAQNLNENIPVRPLLVRAVGTLAVIGIIPFGLLVLYGDVIFTYYLGETWTPAGNFARYIAPWLFFNFIVSPVSFIPTLYRRQKPYFHVTLGGNVLTLLAVLACGYFHTSFEVVLICLTSYYVVYNFLLILWFYKITGQQRQPELQ